MQYYEDAKTSFVVPVLFGFPQLRFHSYDSFLNASQVNHELVSPRFLNTVKPWQTSFYYGNGRTSCVPVFPSSIFDMASDPGRTIPAPSTSKRWFDIAPTIRTVKASTSNRISGLNTYLQQSLSTLHANISIDYARLASGGWRLLTRRDLFTRREMLRCFFQLIIYLITPRKSPSHGLSQRDPISG